jgi:hypothetical protein
MGRWTQQDPIGGSIANPATVNRYAYVNGDPVNATDPSGRSFISCGGSILDIVGGSVLGVVGGLFGIIQARLDLLCSLHTPGWSRGTQASVSALLPSRVAVAHERRSATPEG